MTEPFEQVLAEAVDRLRPVVGENARREANLFLNHAMALSRVDTRYPVRHGTDDNVSGKPGPSSMLTGDAGRIDASAVRTLRLAVAARLQRQPVSQILGYRWFWKHRFSVNQDVLDPRPETEVLVERALEGPDFLRILDLGTGSGCLLASLLAERPKATGVGIDIDEAALQVARRNIEVLGVSGRAELRRSDWFSAVAGQFDLVVCNPPYIADREIPALEPEVRTWEPRVAISGGEDGLSHFREIAAGLRSRLRPRGRALFEIGPTQAGPVTEIFAQCGGFGVRVHPDLDGRDRVIELTLVA
ncbi:MAG: peptide chain release factor N(5)-glutamine methyltransferase [Paracoccaceae bacterium]|nr:peptide chain release factor N(5)-glutamine methyltransferase [Paracoccaceae bacterium]